MPKRRYFCWSLRNTQTSTVIERLYLRCNKKWFSWIFYVYTLAICWTTLNQVINFPVGETIFEVHQKPQCSWSYTIFRIHVASMVRCAHSTKIILAIAKENWFRFDVRFDINGNPSQITMRFEPQSMTSHGPSSWQQSILTRCGQRVACS